MSPQTGWASAVIPPRLRAGDQVAVVAPAGPVPRDGFAVGLAVLEQRYKVRWSERIFDRHGFLAGEDDKRAQELQAALDSPDVRAIVCARGGYGLLRILDKLDPEGLRRDPKPIVGFSDCTALLAWAGAKARVRGIHGPMVVQLGKLPPEDATWLFDLLERPGAIGPLPLPLTRLGARGGGSVRGRLVPGNLEVITRLIGTPWQMDLGAAILGIEDVGERPYRIDRMLTQLHAAGLLDGVRGVVTGDFTRCEEPDGTPPDVWGVIDERLHRFEVPALAGLPFGHGVRNIALPVGARCEMDLAAGQLSITEGAVA
jgi:muramoyltetrapeptide carboxypeptidase